MKNRESSGKTRKILFLGTKKHMQQGLSLFKKGEYQRAIEQFELILLHDKNYVRAYNNLGYVYQEIGEYDKAFEAWQMGLKIDDSYGRIRKNIKELRQMLQSRVQERSEDPMSRQLDIDNFVDGIEWLSKEAELIELRESRFFETYLIEDAGSQFAFKTLSRTLLANPAARKSFEDACSDWLRLGPNKYVIEARSFENVVSRPFLTLEFAPEGSLRSLLDKGWAIASPEYGSAYGNRETLSLMQILEFAVQLCIGLHAIHSAIGAAHGDIRPENVLLYGVPGETRDTAPRFRLKITNVGLWFLFAKNEVSLATDGKMLPALSGEGLVRTKSGHTTSSLSWCAPELIEFIDAPSIATDVYSFGVVIYEMITGMLPFSGSRPDELLRSITQERPAHPSTINTRIPHRIGSLSMRCLEVDPDERYADFFEIGEAIVRYLADSRQALEELANLCRRFKKISKLRFREEVSGEDVMIVGGTEFASEVGQTWEILKHGAEKESDRTLGRQLTQIEEALSLPGITIGELYPTLSDITTALILVPPEKYRDELTSVGNGNRRLDLEKASAEDNSIIEVTLDSDESSPDGPYEDTAVSTTEVFGWSVAEKYSSLIIIDDTMQANRLLAKAIMLRSEMLLLQSQDAPTLLEAFNKVAGRQEFHSWLGPIFDELPVICDCPGARDFLENGMESEQEIVAAVCGLIFMMGDKFSEAQETLNMIPDSRYLQALNICMWAMSKFQAPNMAKIRRSSLKSATGLLRESILVNEKVKKRSTVVFSSHPGARLVDSFFLRGLIFEQLGEHKHSISNIRECKRILRSGEKLYPNVGPWANLAQGKSFYEMGMPSEAFIRWKRALMHEFRSPWFSFLELGASKPRALLAAHILQCCDEALSRYIDSSLLWCVKAKLLGCIDNDGEMFECVKRALELEEGYVPAYFVKMEALTLAGRFTEALESLKICTLRQPHEPIFMLREAEILCRLGEDNEALLELKKAIGHGLDLSELNAGIKAGRLGALERFDEFSEILMHLESV
jgi:serine/threonine protein kinase